ncbi:hypothetical protein [Streptomyces collinus]|uniref:hypothetical protein n=1 Tax=Streptomyces collinus TaxID=42684 RepID=UPI0036347B26
MRVSRPLAALTGVALFGIALTGCQDQASGTITARNGATPVQSLTNPPIKGCHRFDQGVTHVDNFTLSSVLLYTTPDCTVPKGQTSIYLDMQASDEVVRSNGLWHSFSFAPD